MNKIENELITQQLSGIDLDGDMEYNIDPEIFETKKKQYINMLEAFFGGSKMAKVAVEIRNQFTGELMEKN